MRHPILYSFKLRITLGAGRSLCAEILNSNGDYPVTATRYPYVPLICEEMHFRLIGRKKFFTAGRVGPLLPPGKLALLRGRTLKNGDRQSIDTKTER